MGGLDNFHLEPRTVPMIKLAIPSWLRNAGAALSGQHGAVTEQAQRAGCSRQTVYNHAEQLVERLAHHDQEVAGLRSEVERLKAERHELLQQAVIVGKEGLERFAVVSQAMGIS